MAHLRNTVPVVLPEPTGGDWDTATHASVQTTLTPGGDQLFKDDIDDFTAKSGNSVSLAPGDLRFAIPHGEMPDSETLLAIKLWMAARVPGLSMNAAGTDWANANGTAYFALHTADPGDGDANELSGNGYARTAITVGTSGGTAATVQAFAGLPPV